MCQQNQKKLQLMVFILTLLRLKCHSVPLDAPPSRIFFVSIPDPSHLNVLIAIAKALPRHHHIAFGVFESSISTVLQKFENDRSPTIVSLGPVPSISVKAELLDGESNLAYMSRVGMIWFLRNYIPMHNGLLTHFQKHSYDMMIVDVFAFAAQDVAHDLRIPMVIQLCSTTFSVLDLPAWIPRGHNILTSTQLKNSFTHRFYNHIAVPVMTMYYFNSQVNVLNGIRRSLNCSISGNLFSLSNPNQHMRKHPVIVSSPIAFEFKHSQQLNYHFTGFIRDYQSKDHMTSAEESIRIDTWLNKTEVPNEFVVLVTFGTISLINEKTWITIIKTLRLVPNMRLLLAIRQLEVRETIEASLTTTADQTSRILIVSWISQQRILAHPAVRIFLTHGGLNSVGEAIHAHVPLIILAGFGDQHINAAKVIEANIGHGIDRSKATSGWLAVHIKKIQSNHDDYVKRLIRLHQLNELEGGGAKQAAKLIDGWLLTGYSHTIPLDDDLSFLVVTSLDVRLTLIIFLILISYLSFRGLRFLIHTCIFSEKKEKQA